MKKMTKKDPEQSNKNIENEHQTKLVFNSNEKKPPSSVANFLLIIGGIIGSWVLSALASALIFALVGFVAFYIVCGGEFGVKW